MKVTRVTRQIKLDNVMDVSFDVSMDKLNAFFEVGDNEFSDEFRNRTSVIEEKLSEYYQIAQDNGKNTLRVICEPTGHYSNSLLRTAKRLGFFTTYVNTEHVAKFRVVETNDAGKTDEKDPRIMRTLGKINKTIKHRTLGNNYLLLRKLGRMYHEEDISYVRARCRIHRVLGELFCDYSFKTDFLYSRSGRTLMHKYSYNPYRIKRSGFTRFQRVMKKSVSGIRRTSIQRLWDDAQSSIKHQLPKDYIDSLQTHLEQLWGDFIIHEQRKIQLGTELEKLLERIRENDPNIPPPTPGLISAKWLALLLAETGPLGDFPSWKQIVRYAGLNICMQQSGKYTGQNKISKKGRPLLRKALGRIVFPLVTKESLYGEYYNRKTKIDKMSGTKAMTAVMRSFLKKFYCLYKSGQQFNQDRWFVCDNQYLKKSA